MAIFPHLFDGEPASSFEGRPLLFATSYSGISEITLRRSSIVFGFFSLNVLSRNVTTQLSAGVWSEKSVIPRSFAASAVA